MADLYYIDSGYLTPDTGYYTYIADGAATPVSQFTITCAIGKQQSASASLSGSVSITATATKIISASAAFTSAFSPTLSITVFKNSFAVLDSPSVLSATPVVNRSITQTVDTIATLNAMAAKTAGFNSSISSMAAVSATVTAVKSTSASITSSASLSASAENVQLASAALSSASSLTASRYLGYQRPAIVWTGTGSASRSVDVYKYGSHSFNGIAPATGYVKNSAGTNVKNTDSFIKANQEFAIEFHYYRDSNSFSPNNGANGDVIVANGPYPGTTSSLYQWSNWTSTATISWAFGFVFAANNRYQWRFRFNDGSSLIDVDTAIASGSLISNLMATATWYHVAIVRGSDGIIRIKINGTDRATYSYSGAIKQSGTAANALVIRPYAIRNATTNESGNLDEYVYKVGSSTLTTATSAGTNDGYIPYQQALLHFDEANGVNIDDDLSFVASASAALSSSSTLSATGSKIQNVSAELNSVSTVSAIANKTVQAVSAQNSTVTMTVTSTRIQNASATLSSLVTESVEGTRAKGFTATLNTVSAVDCKGKVKANIIDIHLPAVTATMNIDYVRVRSGDSAFTSAFSPTLSVTAQLAGVALLESSSTLSATAAKTVGISSDLNTAFTQSTNAGRLIAITGSLSSVSTLGIAYQHLVGVSATANSQFTITVDVTRTRTVNSTQSSTASLTASASRTRDATATANSTVTESITVTRIRSGAMTVNSVVTVTAAVTKTARASAVISSSATQTVAVIKTARATASFAAIATELTAAFKNATGTITMESMSTVTALVGKVVEFQHNNSHTGLQLPYFADNGEPLKYTVFPKQINTIYDAKSIAIWFRRDTTTSSGIIILSQANYSDPINGYVKLDGTTVIVEDPGYSGTPYTLSWTNSFPADTSWHHIFLKYSTQSGFYGDGYKLWVDGSYKGYREFQSIEAGVISFSSNVKDCRLGADSPLGISGGVAQIRIGDSTINWWDVYDPQKGYVDLGATGQGQFNQLSAPGIYATLDYPWTRVEVENNEDHLGFANFRAAVESINDDDLRVYSLLTSDGVLVLVLSATLTSTTSQTTEINYLVNSSSQCSMVSTATAIASRTRTLSSAQSAQFTQSLTASRTRNISADFHTQASVSAVTGYVNELSALLNTTATVFCEPTEIQAIQGSAALNAEFTVTAVINERQGFVITPSSEFSLACAVTVKPPIRITSDLTSTATVTATLTRVQAFSVTLNSLFTVTADITKIKGIIANLSSNSSLSILVGRRIQGAATLAVQAFELTQGDILNFAPELTLYVTQETRTRRVLPENRLYSIDSESRTRKVLAESRVITIESQTEVNII